MSFHQSETIKNTFKKNNSIGHHYQTNKKLIEENWEKIKKNPKLEKKDLEKINKLIVQEGNSTLSTWKTMRNISFFLAIVFLIVIYFIFRYITSGFEIIEDSFTNIFCPV